MAQSAYCVRCQRKVIPGKVVRVRVGKRPAAKGICSQCGGTVYRFL
jgi:RNase P subunit RPR2